MAWYVFWSSSQELKTYWSNIYLHFQVMDVGVEVEFYILKTIVAYVKKISRNILC